MYQFQDSLLHALNHSANQLEIISNHVKSCSAVEIETLEVLIKVERELAVILRMIEC